MSLTSLRDGLQLAIHFNGDVKDRSGKNNHGIAAGGAVVDTDNQKHGSGCYYFDGVNDSIILPLLNFDEISVDFWFKRLSIDSVNADTVFGAWYYNANLQLREGFDVARFGPGANTTLNFTLITKTGGGVRTQKATDYIIGDTVDEYVYCVATYNKTTGVQKLFVDGILRDIITHTAGNTIVPLTQHPDMRIGYSRINTGFFHGYIDTLRIWNRPLLDGGVAVGEYAGEEIALLYNKGQGREIIILPKGTATGKPVIDGQREPVLSSTEQITGLSAVKGLTVPAGTRLVVLEAETQAVRWRDDGTDPSATVGMPLLAGVPKTYTGDFSAIKFKEQVASAKLNVSYYK